MTTETETRTVTIERELPHPPARVWRALTQPHLLAEWLMPSDFRAEIGHGFTFANSWGKITCQVRAIEHERLLSYSWAAADLESVVTFTLRPLAGGTLLTMAQTGFLRTQGRAFGGARLGWTRFLDNLETLLADPGTG